MTRPSAVGEAAGGTRGTGPAPGTAPDPVPRPAGAVVAPSDVRAPDALAVVTQGLSKRFRSGQLAVDGLDLHVERGAVYGFLGPNGSGKTTTIRMLLGLVRPTAGRAWLLGRAMPEAGAEVLPRVGVLVEGPAFHPYLSGRANLERLDAVDRTADRASSRARIGDALERVGLAAAAGKPFRQYSLGMKQRLGLAAALLRPRELLVLDEPTNGLDPQGTREVRALVRELADGGTTVLVSSHLLAEIEQVCSHVGIMSRGRLALEGERRVLLEASDAHLHVTTTTEHRAVAGEVLAGLGLADVTVDGALVTARLGAAAPEDVSAALVGAGVPLAGFEVRRLSLEQLFVQLTGEGFDVER